MVAGERLGVSERRACRALHQHRSVQRRLAKVKTDEAALTTAIVELAKQYGRYGYRRITALLKRSSWRVNSKRVERIWRQKGLKVLAIQPKRGRLRLNDGSRFRLRPEHTNHVWAYDSITDRTSNGKAFRMLNVVDEYTRECLAITVERKLNSNYVLDTLSELFTQRGPPAHIRSDSGPEFCAQAVKLWLERLRVKTLFIEPGSRWQNGYVESFNGKLWDELLNGAVFSTSGRLKCLSATGVGTITATARTLML